MQQKKFESFGLEKDLVDVLARNQFTQPTLIQLEAIPLILEGKDIFALAKTGSGKTGAFVIPLLQKILMAKRETSEKSEEIPSPFYLIVAPTRELAMQIESVAESFGKELGIHSLLVIGGESIDKQKKIAEEGFDILIATPGRLIDLYHQKIISLKSTKGLVLDEVDRLFDMGFKKDIGKIISFLPKDREIYMFSATTNMEVLQTAYRFHSVPHEIKIDQESMLVERIKHQVYHVADGEKMPLLVGLLKKFESEFHQDNEESQKKDHHILIFCNTQVQTDVISEWLKNLGFKADALYGNLSQSKRNTIIKKFRNQEINILVSTDVAARGLDIDGVSLVLNYDLPQDSSSYVHRIGRTGRAGKSGLAINLCSFSDCPFLDQIEEFIGEKIPSETVEDSLLEKDLGERPKIKRKADLAKERQQENGAFKKNVKFEKARVKDVPRKNVNSRPQIKTIEESEMKSEESLLPSVNRKFFTVTSFKLKEAQNEAMGFFPINTIDHLQFQILERGRPAFFFFGPRKTTYKFSVRPEYEYYTDIFLHEVIKLMDLDLDYQIKVQKGHISVKFEGNDEPLLRENRGDALYGLEHLLKKYLGRFIVLERSFKISMGNISTEKKSPEINEKKLISLADKMKKKVLEQNRPVILRPLSPAERRIVHQHLDQDQEVTTTSIGNGRFKKIKIEAKA